MTFCLADLVTMACMVTRVTTPSGVRQVMITYKEIKVMTLTRGGAVTTPWGAITFRVMNP